jgi:hypothetical protein
VDDRDDFRRTAFGASRRLFLSSKLALLPRHFFVSHRRSDVFLTSNNRARDRTGARLGATECCKALLRR